MNLSEEELAEGILFTDMYQLTMAQLYFRMGLQDKTVQFDHFFRDYPDYGTHKAGYCISAGLDWLLDWMARAHFGEQETSYLKGLKRATGSSYLRMIFSCGLKTTGISLRFPCGPSRKEE